MKLPTETLQLNFTKLTPELINFFNQSNSQITSITFKNKIYYITFTTSSPDPVTQYIYNNFTDILISE